MENQKNYGNTTESNRNNQGTATDAENKRTYRTITDTYPDRQEGNLNNEVPKDINDPSRRNPNGGTPDDSGRDKNDRAEDTEYPHYPNSQRDNSINDNPGTPKRDENRQDKEDEFDESRDINDDEFLERDQKRQRQTPDAGNTSL